MAPPPAAPRGGPPPLAVLFATAEIGPWIRTGGLGEVAAALPLQLRSDGVDVRVLVPGYPAVVAALASPRVVAEFRAPGGALPAARVLAADTPAGLPLLAIDCPPLYERPGNPYLDASGRDWPDNHLRFGLLSRMAALLAAGIPGFDWTPNIVHCNDWHTGLAAAYMRFAGTAAVRTVFSIHNIAYQGVFPPAVLAALGLPAEAFVVNGVEYYGSVSFLKAGIQYSDAVTTVSPTHAREIQQERFGFGMAGLLRSRAADLTGILNGIDTSQWNPATDPHLPQRYDAASVEGKTVNKHVLQRRLDLALGDAMPLIGVVSRLTDQKGIDLLLAIAGTVMNLPAQLAVLGSGDAPLEDALTTLARHRSERCAAVIGFDEPLAHLIEAGADIFAMPSRYEPCGLNQMYSLLYGTPPVVHATGGLADTVVDCTDATLAEGRANGFTFAAPTSAALAAALERAVSAWHDRARWRKLQLNGMQLDFGWQRSARQYRELYERLVAAPA